MTRFIEALYENGVLRPLHPIEGVAEHSRVRVAVELEDATTSPLMACIGTLPDEDAEEMIRAIEEEFERIDPDDWR